FREAVNEAGFGYIDWNSINGDAESVVAKPADQQLARLKETVNGQSGLIVLMHDAINKDATVDALPEIIKYLRKKGYRFELIPGVR
ncbi:MAG: polysaccharide deacetylase, partial [Clostridiales bacterium]|nr:polysaccharide deacetylase [Clostridiales bacterium]